MGLPILERGRERSAILTVTFGPEDTSLITLASVLADYLKGVTLFQKKALCLETIFSHCLVEGLETPSSQFIGSD